MSMNALVVHLGWTTKHRKPVLDEAFDLSLEAAFDKCLSNKNAKLLAFGASIDHVHLAVSFLPTHAISDLVRDLKRAGARTLKREHEVMELTWQSSYWALTARPGHCADLFRYIRNQRAHHQDPQAFEIEQDHIRERVAWIAVTDSSSA